MPKIKKTGEKISWKEAGKRFKAGVEGITPLQQAKISIQGTWISIAGVILGIIVSIVTIKSLWWVLVILIGGLVVTLSSLIGMYQKYWGLKKINDIMNSVTTNFINEDNTDIKEEIKEDVEVLKEEK